MDRCLVTALSAVLLVIAAAPRVCAQSAPPPAHGKRAVVTANGESSGTPAAAASAPSANEKAARDAFERGRVFYDAGAFDQASAAFEEAHRLSGRDQLLYNVYLAYRDANQPAKAAEALRGFLAKVPSIDNRAQLEARLAALDQGLAQRAQQDARAAEAARAQAPVVAAAPPPVVATPVAAEPSRGRSARFWAGVSLSALGGAMMLSSIGTGVIAHNHQQKLADDCAGKVCDSSLKATADSGKTLAHATDGLLFGGLAVAAGGAALLFLFGGLERDSASARARSDSGPAPLTASCSSHGCAASATLRF